MKLTIPRMALSLIVLFVTNYTIAQPAPNTEVILSNINIQKQADSLKHLFELDDFVLVREAPLAMTSQYEKPIIVSLKEGTWYRVSFIGDVTSKLYEIRMYDWAEKRVVYLKQSPKEIEGNVLNYDYIPRFTEFHIIKPVQVSNKKKEVNGYMMLFKKVIK